MINATDYWSISLGLAALVWLGLWIDTQRLSKVLPGPLVVIVGASLLSNTGVLPIKSSLYGSVVAFTVPLAIPLLLFKANLRTLVREAGGVLTVFLLAALATIIGTVLAYFVTDLGDEAAKIAGAFTGSWIGGAMNIVAVSEAVEMVKSTSAVAISVNGPICILALLVLMTLPTLPFVRRFCRSEHLAADAAAPVAPDDASKTSQWPPFKPLHICGALVISLAICAGSKLLAHALGIDKFAILIITLAAVVAVNLKPGFFAGLSGSFELGMLFMYVFFAAIGASTDISVFIEQGSGMALFGLIALSVHILLMLLAARIFKLRLEEVVIASSAAIVGPGSTVALASARGWRHLVTPGVLCGVFGYVIANFAGVFIANVLP